MSDYTYPNGQILQSSSLSPEQMQQVFQMLVIQIFGTPLSPLPPPDSPAYDAVRCGYQDDGEPSWDFAKDTCIITSFPLGEPFSRVRDQRWLTNDNVSLLNPMSYTQVWRIHFTLYGPNAFDRARLIVSTIFGTDWARNWLINNCPQSGVPVVQPIYPIPDIARPVRNRELFQRRWWNRVDVDLKFNELVIEQIIVPSAAGTQITIDTDTGITQSVNVTL
jgi:hypothetical protein